VTNFTTAVTMTAHYCQMQS